MRRTLLLALNVAFLSTAAPAFAGWHAVLEEKVVAGPPSVPRKPIASEYFFEGHKLRVDQSLFTSLILDFQKGGITLLNHVTKTYVDTTLDEMIKDRAKSGAPKKANDFKLVKTTRQETHGKLACTVYTWKNETSEGETCVAGSPGVDLKTFIAATTDFGKKLREAMDTPPGSASRLLESAKIGFPVKSKETSKIGKGVLEMTSEMKTIEAMTVPAEKFQVPANYKPHNGDK